MDTLIGFGVVLFFVILIGAILGIFAYSASRRNATQIKQLRALLSKTTSEIHALQERHNTLQKRFYRLSLQTTSALKSTPKDAQDAAISPSKAPSSAPHTIESSHIESSTESSAQIPKTPKQTPAQHAKALTEATPTSPIASLTPQHAFSKPQAPKKVREARFSFEQLFTQKIMVFVAGIFFIFAAFFLIRYSIENALLTPLARIILALSFGLVLIIASFVCAFFMRTNALSTGSALDSVAHSPHSPHSAARAPTMRPKQSPIARLFSRANAKTLSIIAQTCIGAGLVVEFFSVYGGYRLYGFFGVFGTFIALCTIACVALVLSLRFGLVIGIFGVLGGFSTPLLLATPSYNAPLLFAYLCVFYTLVAYLSYKSKSVWLLSIASLFVLLYALEFCTRALYNASNVWLVFFAVWLVLGAHIILLACLCPIDSARQSFATFADTRALRRPDTLLQLSFLTMSFLGFAVFLGLSLNLRGMALQSLELGFLSVLCALVLLLPRLRSLASFKVAEWLLSIPIVFALVLVVSVLSTTPSTTQLIWCGFMGVFALGIALNAYYSPHKAWYLWLLWACAVLFGVCALDSASLLALVLFVGIYAAVARYGIALRNDNLLLLCVAGFFIFVPIAYHEVWLSYLPALPYGFGGSGLWMLSGVVLVALGRTRLLPRAIVGIEWVFVGCGVAVLYHSTRYIDFGEIFTLLSHYDNGAFLSIYCLVSVLNFALFARFTQGKNLESSDYTKARKSTQRDRVILYALGALSLVLSLLLIQKLCASALMPMIYVEHPYLIESDVSEGAKNRKLYGYAWFAKELLGATNSTLALSIALLLAWVASQNNACARLLKWLGGAIDSNHTQCALVARSLVLASLLLSLWGEGNALMIALAVFSTDVREYGLACSSLLLVGLFGAVVLSFALNLLLQKLWQRDCVSLALKNPKWLFAILDTLVFVLGLMWAWLTLEAALLFALDSLYAYRLYAQSLLLALLGIACLVGFLRTRINAFRIYSIALFVLAALKVFFVDTSGFGGLAKVGLFVLMGALFLLISLLYSRYVFKK